MSKKRTRLILFMSAICVVIGGIIMFGFHRMSEEEKLQAQIRKEQERMVLYAVNHYEGIEKIEFTSFEENRMTGSWTSYAIANDRFDILFTLKGFDGDITVAKGRDAQSGEYLRVRDKEGDLEVIENVEVMYWGSDR
ncbi:TPA: hypothetical protein U1C23_002235 [Streptococcus suis]|nr:hypothetical protein [Streptococcus suis]